MNKPIIVDGVDISECEFFSNMSNGEPATKCNLYKNMFGGCTDCRLNEDAHDCYYKQLQRLKEENEILYKELQYKYEEMDAKGFLLMGEDLNFWKNLKAENEKLKKEVSDLNFYIDSYRQVWEIDKYRKALEEIHNLLSQSMDIKLKSADKHFSLIDEAIEKINEVLKDE